MRRSIALLSTGLVVAGVMTGVPASAAPIDKGHFTVSGEEDFDCETVVPAVRTHHEWEARGSFVFNQRGGPNVFPYFRESLSGTNVYTNLETGGTYTQVFTGNSRDHKIIDNGDGTITIISAEWFGALEGRQRQAGAAQRRSVPVLYRH